MTRSNSFIRPAIAAFVAAFFAVAPYQAAQAQRTSLSDIDRKLDEALSILHNGPPPPTQRIVFVTSTSHDGNFGGLAGADAICNARAKEAGLPGAGNYLAWLSTDALSPADRFVRSSVPYVRTDGVVIANDWADLTDSLLAAAINRDENATTISPEFIWTGTTATGDNLFDSNCDGWTKDTSLFEGRRGRSELVNFWTNHTDGTCAPAYRHYCFQQ